MKIEYDILWVDDDIDSVQEDIEEVREFLDRHGIEANIKDVRADGTEKIYGEVGKSIQDPNLDMIVVDYSMAAEGDADGVNGEKVIDTIRQSDNVFLPVIFYSSQYEALLEAVAEKNLDGVYFAQRDRLVEKLTAVVESLLRKEQTSNRTRGLLIEGVSEIDARLGDLLQLVWSRLGSEQQEELHKYFQEKVGEIVERSQKNAEEYPDLANFQSNMTANFVSYKYETNTRWKVLKKGMKMLNVDTSIFNELFEKSDGEALVGLRNKYGHWTRSSLETIHNEKLCVTIRRELRRQMKHLDHLMASI